MQGLPSSWDQTAATLYSEVYPYGAIWSPCNRVIAIIDEGSVVTVDAATLSRLDTFTIPPSVTGWKSWQPSFSPDGHRLALIGRWGLISWDLQTDGPLGAIPSGLETEGHTVARSSTYSEDGKAVAVAATYSSRDFFDDYDTFDGHNTFVHTYDLSGTEADPHCALKGRIIEPIWTHGRCIRFLTINRGSVAVSEVEFTLKNPPVEVESLPIADKIVDGDRFLFLPSLSRLAFILKDTIQVWDAKAAKLLLKSELPPNPYPYNSLIGSFSSDGHFFAHMDKNGIARVWKESPTGYVLHQKLQFITNNLREEPRLSPSGESIIMSPGYKAFHLWHTRDHIPSLTSISRNHFTLAFSPDERIAAFARRGEKMVTVFNSLTGDLQLAVDTDMRVVCLGITGSALIVVGEEKIVTWDLPSGDCAFNTSTNDSVRTTTLHHNQCTPVSGSISPDFSRIAVLSTPDSHYRIHLQIYDMSTGRCLTSAEAIHAGVADNAWWAGFTRDEREVWTAWSRGERGWKIVEDSESGSIRLEPRDEIVRPSGVPPWESRRGYEVTGDGWVLSATQKRLLWLPHRWRSYKEYRTWSGRFLGLLQKELLEVVILEFPE